MPPAAPHQDHHGDAGPGHEVDALVARGPRARFDLIRLADRGDWRTRVLALSGLGTMVRADRSAHSQLSALAWLARVPGVRRHVGSVGRRGQLVSPSLANALSDKLFIVRTAAVLALGECRDPALAPLIAPLQDDRLRPVRLAAAAALVACDAGDLLRQDIADAEPTPDRIADGADTAAWLQRLAAAHGELLAAAIARHGDPQPGADVAAWLAGRVAASSRGGVTFEAARYEHEVDLAYQLQKPFGHEDRRENLRQLDALIALLAHLDLPRGARVIDLGGGTGWVAEFLARFGFRPIVIDVAMPLLSLARTRLTTARLRGAVVAGDMTALPLSPQSVDAVIVLDALHHVGHVAAVLGEVRRVLAPGGLLLLAEPGEGHSESPKSLAETHQHGVREGEVHPSVIWDAAKVAGFTRGMIVPRTPATLVLSLDDLPAAMRTPADAWIGRDGDSVVRLETALIRSMLARPLLVLSAGERPRDSRSPGALRARILPALTRAGHSVRGAIAVENTGDTTWLNASNDGTGVVCVGIQLLTPTNQLVDREWWRGRIPVPVPPGAGCTVDVEASLPSDTDAFRLKVDLVAERVCWFEDYDSRTPVVDV